MKLRIGVIAREFPPDVGGMAVLGEHVVRGLSSTDDVVVFTREGWGVNEHAFRHEPILTGSPYRDAGRLGSWRVDVWLALNARYAVIAGELKDPMCIYCHGNDFLRQVHTTNPIADRVFEKFGPLRRFHAPVANYFGQREFRRAVPAIRQFFTNSEYTATLFERCYGRRPIVVYPGVDNRYFVERDTVNGSRDVLRLLTVSRLSSTSARKNIDGVLKAVSLLPEGLHVRYTVVGEGNDRQRLETLAQELELGDRVRFAGRIAIEELVREYQRADLFVLAPKASKRDVEGFGMVYLEACASGTPVLCSREAGVTEVVVDGKTGIVVQCSDPYGIADGIVRFASSREEIDAQAIRRFATKFQWPAVVGRLRGHLEAALRSTNHTGRVIGNRGLTGSVRRR
ncbi:MAG: glycosyltransferase family 4 protein [Arenicellales bacterium]